MRVSMGQRCVIFYKSTSFRPHLYTVAIDNVLSPPPQRSISLSEQWPEYRPLSHYAPVSAIASPRLEA